MGVYMGAGGDVLAGHADDLAVLEHGFAGGDGTAGDLVPGGNVVQGVQGDTLVYAMFSQDLATRIRGQAATIGPLIKGFGAVKTVEYVKQEGEAQMFKVTFDNQVTEWLIGFDAEDKIAALLFRPAER